MRTIGLLGAFVQISLAALLSGIARGPGSFPSPPEPIPRGLALGLLYAIPAVIGALGAIGGRRSLLAAAAVLSSIGSVVAFSGVTLIFLAAAIVFAAAAGGTRSESTPRSRPSWRTVVVLVLATAMVAVAALRIGILVLPVIVVLVVALEVWRAAGHARTAIGSLLGGLIVAVAVVGLGIGSGWALLSMTETRCWKAYQTPVGIEYRTIPDPGGGQIELGRDEIAGGCDSGPLTPEGAGLASMLGLTAIALAAVTAGRCGSAPSRSS